MRKEEKLIFPQYINKERLSDLYAQLFRKRSEPNNPAQMLAEVLRALKRKKLVLRNLQAPLQDEPTTFANERICCIPQTSKFDVRPPRCPEGYVAPSGTLAICDMRLKLNAPARRLAELRSLSELLGIGEEERLLLAKSAPLFSGEELFELNGEHTGCNCFGAFHPEYLYGGAGLSELAEQEVSCLCEVKQCVGFGAPMLNDSLLSRLNPDIVSEVLLPLKSLLADEGRLDSRYSFVLNAPEDSLCYEINIIALYR